MSADLMSFCQLYPINTLFIAYSNEAYKNTSGVKELKELKNCESQSEHILFSNSWKLEQRLGEFGHSLREHQWTVCALHPSQPNVKHMMGLHLLQLLNPHQVCDSRMSRSLLSSEDTGSSPDHSH